jgi:hypothetical protein
MAAAHIKEGNMRPIIPAVGIALALGATAALAADPVYKSTMPNGRVIYGESPVHGAKRVDKVAAPPERTGVQVATDDDKARAAQVQEQRGGVSVIPQPPHQTIRPAVTGESANPGGNLPSRGY